MTCRIWGGGAGEWWQAPMTRRPVSGKGSPRQAAGSMVEVRQRAASRSATAAAASGAAGQGRGGDEAHSTSGPVAQEAARSQKTPLRVLLLGMAMAGLMSRTFCGTCLTVQVRRSLVADTFRGYCDGRRALLQVSALATYMESTVQQSTTCLLWCPAVVWGCCRHQGCPRPSAHRARQRPRDAGHGAGGCEASAACSGGAEEESTGVP